VIRKAQPMPIEHRFAPGEADALLALDRRAFGRRLAWRRKRRWLPCAMRRALRAIVGTR
jgi:hypothetical protein